MTDEKVEFSYPPEWDDDERMNGLFAPFREKSMDSIAWESKIKFWTQLIKNNLLFYESPSFSLGYLKQKLNRKGKFPTCLETVITELQRTKKIVLADDYSNLDIANNSLTSWLFQSLVKNPMLWTFNKITSPLTSKPDQENIRFLHLEVAKEIGGKFFKNLSPEQKGKLLVLKSLSNLKEEEIALIVKPLLVEGKAAVTFLSPETVIKFAKENQTVVKITEADIGIFQLEQNERVLTTHIEALEKERENALEKVKSSLKSNRKQMALSHLRRKKELEKYIEKRTNALENLRSLLDKLRQIESDSLILDSYRLGISALKQSLVENGLSEKTTEATMDELEDVLDITKDIDQTLSRPLDHDADEDLEAELSLLLEEGDGQDGQAGNTSGAGDSADPYGLPDIPEDLEKKGKLEERLKALSL